MFTEINDGVFVNLNKICTIRIAKRENISYENGKQKAMAYYVFNFYYGYGDDIDAIERSRPFPDIASAKKQLNEWLYRGSENQEERCQE